MINVSTKALVLVYVLRYGLQYSKKKGANNEYRLNSYMVYHTRSRVLDWLSDGKEQTMRLIDADALAYIVACNGDADFINKVTRLMLDAPSIDICFCRECKWEWTQTCPPHRMGLIHDENDYCSYGIRKGEDDEMS